MAYWIALLIEFILIFATSQYLVKSLGFVLYKILRSTRLVITIMALIFFPGVVIHELSHMLTAGILFVRIYDIEFLPEIRGDTVKLGSVRVGESDFVRRFFIGVAPFMLGTIIMLLLIWYLGQGFSLDALVSLKDTWKYLLLIYGVFVISNTMFSSSKDLEGAGGFILVVFVLALALFFINKNIYVTMFTQMSLPTVITFLQPVALLLLIPLVLNLLLIGGCSLIVKR